MDKLETGTLGRHNDPLGVSIAAVAWNCTYRIDRTVIEGRLISH